MLIQVKATVRSTVRFWVRTVASVRVKIIHKVRTRPRIRTIFRKVLG